MEEIRPSHKAFWKVTKALKTEGYIPIPPLKRPENSVALDDAEIAECLADSIETQCSHASPPHDIAHINRIEEEQIDGLHLDVSVLTRPDVLRAGVPQGSALIPCCTPRTQTIYRDRRLASNSRYSRAIARSYLEVGIGAPIHSPPPPEGH
ncbi:hypothetical protein EVAR_57699_1 [Eumeta japonica]|uniref:Uncharacterized protein n=1 Tax=Eumeta variegata TaxID=151549 RepID=A0A4C1YA20_EUMVA|nr:hypothetical protein EVAR_57699_1 [Eumeta japonica]